MPTPAIPVAEFRRRVDHLARVVNVDYHACVNANEMHGWLRIVERLVAEVEQLVCRHASACDQAWRGRVTVMAAERRDACLARIAAADHADQQRTLSATIIPFVCAAQLPLAIH